MNFNSQLSKSSTSNFNSSTSTTNSTMNKPNGNATFKETLKGIENIWDSFREDLDKKKKDLEEIKKMEAIYKTEDFTHIIEAIEQEIGQIKEKLVIMQKMVWDVRTRIQFS
tara:strand:+ start:165 stop:497 length:333 start_codon:yes stop_codon:yes gene_type:complete